MLFPKKNFNYKYSNQNKHAEWDDYDDPDKVGKHQTVFNEDTNDTFYGSNRFGASAKYINTGDFKKQTSTAHSENSKFTLTVQR